MTKYKEGDIITVKVIGIKDYGIFVDAKDNYKGLIHISEISNKFVENIGNYAKIGDKLQVQIINNDETKKQLKLSIKSLDSNTIKEYGLGFKPLKDHINEWIESYKD